MKIQERSTTRSLDTPPSRLKPPSSGVTLWRPDLVLSGRAPRVAPHRSLVTPGEPAFRPEAVRAQVDAAQSLLQSFTEARDQLSVQAARAEAREQHATSDSERVAAAMETYRVKAELDEMLTRTMRRMTALMEGRSLR